MKTKPAAPRNRAAEARAKGRRLAMFEISEELDALIERVRSALAARLGSCTRLQALEDMGRRGAKQILGREGT